jgi:Protein of unknown function (DUF3617)
MLSSNRTVALRVLVACALACATASAQAQSFGAKPGAWEMSSTISGLSTSAIPSEALAKMTPEQRAMVEKRMAERNGQTSTRTTCVTKEDLAKDHFGRSPDTTCTMKTVSRSATKIVMETTCPGPPPSMATMTFEARTPESVTGSIDQQRANGAKIHIGLAGRWLGASCDGIEPMNPRRGAP